MSKVTIILLAIILIGLIIGLYISYKMIKAQRQAAMAQMGVEGSYIVAEGLLDHLDKIYPIRMVFLHHSVGNGFMYKGGLRDSLLNLGVVIRSCTYGDEIGEQTDMDNWLPKFQNDMNKIFTFKAHPNKYYPDDRSNDIIMFKSCYPNSNLSGDGSEPGSATSSDKTIANYKGVFEGLKTEFAKYPNKLFIYVTAPPNVPAVTTPENAARARKFNEWLQNEFLPAYAKETGLDNFKVYDLFNFLAAGDNFLKNEYRWQDNPRDSHPNDDAKKVVAKDFLRFFEPILNDWKSKHES
ncbi:MAG: hypothetical protein R3F48_05430 [Candidatus Zixiibacteriota bacterium]